jgi:hypothetical protein
MEVEQNGAGGQQETDRRQLTSRRADAGAFGDSLVSYLRAGDRAAVIVLLDEMSHDAASFLSSEGEGAREEIGILLDRLACAAAAAVRFSEGRLLESCVRTALAVYMSGFDEDGGQRNARAQGGRISSPLLWFELAQHLFAVGGLAVRRGDWGAVRQLALQMTTDRLSVSRGEGKYWLRHAVSEASNAGIINISDARRGQEVLLIKGALELVEREPCLRPELPAGDYRLLRSLLGFDLLAGLVVSADAGGFDTGRVYPSFIYWNIYEVEPLLARLLRDGEMRAGLFPGGLEDAFLAKVLRGLGRLAERRSDLWSYWGKAASDFLDKYPDTDR